MKLFSSNGLNKAAMLRVNLNMLNVLRKATTMMQTELE